MKRLLLQTLSRAGKLLRHTPIARWKWLKRLLGKAAGSLSSADNLIFREFRVSAPPGDEMITKKLILYGDYDRAEIDLLCSLVRSGDCVLDVGANIGLYTLPLSRAVGPDGLVIAAEPDPQNLVLLRKNIEANGCTNVRVIPEALGDKTGEVKLYQRADNRGALSTVDIFGVGEANAIAISMRRTEDVLERMPRLVKIDVEGQEPLVVAGMGGQLPEIMFFEYAPKQLTAAGHNPGSFLDGLKTKGYTLSVVEPETGKQLPVSGDGLMNVLAIR
jgi:FkbM family methyltransferase